MLVHIERELAAMNAVNNPLVKVRLQNKVSDYIFLQVALYDRRENVV